MTRCTGWTESEEACPLRKKCLRYTIRADFPMSMNMWAPGRYVEDVPGEPPDWVCEYFIIDKEVSSESYT